MSADTSTSTNPPTPASFSEAMLGKELLSTPALARVMAWPAELRAALVACFFSTAVLVPFLGAVGLWDPWETHYGEVAREMVQRNDYVHPFWENAWFFSKPAFTMWMQALGLEAADLGRWLAFALAVALGGAGFFLYRRRPGQVSAVREFWGALLMGWGVVFATLFVWGLTVNLPYTFAHVAGGDGAMPLFTEWGFRLPFAIASIMAVTLMTYAVSVTVNARAGLASAFVLVTMPLYFLLTRQAVTDMPIVAATIAGLSCALVGLFDERSTHRAEWWYASYAFFAVATLAKGLLGFGVPMVVFIAWFFLARMRLGGHLAWLVKHGAMPLATGLAAGVAAGALAATLGRQWGTTFMAVPIIGNGPPMLSASTWLGIMWGSLAFWAVATWQFGVVRRTLKERPPALFAMAYEMRLGTGILLFLALCLPWYYEMFTMWQVDDEGKQFWYRFIIHDHFARLSSGVHTTTPGGEFTYFIHQGGYAMFPWVVLLPGAFAVVARLKVRGGAADGLGLMAVLWFVVSWGLIGASATKFHHYVFSMLPPLAILMGLFLDKLWEEGPQAHGLSLLLGLPILFLVGKDLTQSFKHFTDLFVYNYDRPYPAFLSEQPALWGMTLKQLLGRGTALVALAAGVFALMRHRVGLFATGLAGVLAFALWFNWGHWVDLSHHWTQRDQFWRYYTQRKPGEPITAFLMNWRGETFYSRNTVKQIKDNPNVRMAEYAAQPGRKWALVEHARLGVLKAAVGNHAVTLIDQDLNNKFVLVTIE